jgi:hypothetical protein
LPSASADTGSASIFNPDPVSYKLAQDLSNNKGKSIFVSSTKPIPKFIEPIKHDAAVEQINELITELNDKFLTEITPPTDEYDIEDSLDESEEYGLQVIVVGGSHAGRMASCMDDMKLDVVDLTTPGWTVSEASAEKLTTSLEKVMQEECDIKKVVIYHLFDNSIFYSQRPDGSTAPPFRGGDGKYHIEGALKIIDRPALRDRFNMAAPLMRARGEECKIILSPLLRYIGSKCCNNPSHITNFGEKQYFEKMGMHLGEITDWLKECVHSKRIRNYPNRLLKMGEDDDKAAKRVRTYWNADPVHMCTEGYRQLARGLLDKVALAAESSERKQQQPGSGGPGGSNRRGWTDDAVAHRSDMVVTFRGGHNKPSHWTRGRAAHRGARGGRRGHGGRGAWARGHGGRRYRPY